MMLFIGNLPPSATRLRLAEALRLGREDSQRLRIVRRPGRDGGVQRYAVLHARAPALANRLIARNGRFYLDGRRLVLREFCKRIANNERRAPNWRGRAWAHAERRQNERRHASGERLAA